MYIPEFNGRVSPIERTVKTQRGKLFFARLAMLFPTEGDKVALRKKRYSPFCNETVDVCSRQEFTYKKGTPEPVHTAYTM